MPDGSPRFVVRLDEIIRSCRTPLELERQYGERLARDGTCRRCSFRRRDICDAHGISATATSTACGSWDWDGEPRGAALRAEMAREAREIDAQDGDVGCSGMQGDIE
jgi:hypothetical protein